MYNWIDNILPKDEKILNDFSSDSIDSEVYELESIDKEKANFEYVLNGSKNNNNLLIENEIENNSIFINKNNIIMEKENISKDIDNFKELNLDIIINDRGDLNLFKLEIKKNIGNK